MVEIPDFIWNFSESVIVQVKILQIFQRIQKVWRKSLDGRGGEAQFLQVLQGGQGGRSVAIDSLEKEKPRGMRQKPCV